MNISLENFSQKPDHRREGGFAVSTQSLYKEILRIMTPWPHRRTVEPVKVVDAMTNRSFQVSFLRRSSRIIEVNVVELTPRAEETPLIFCLEMMELENRFVSSVNQKTHHEEVLSGQSLFILERVMKAAAQELKQIPAANVK